MRFSSKILIILFCILMLGGISYLIYNNRKINKVDIPSISIQIDSISKNNDSLKVILPKIETKIINNKETYEKVRTIIINQSTDSDCRFFSDYISGYQRLDSINNSISTKDN